MLGKIIADPRTLQSLADDLDAQNAGFGEKFLRSVVDFCKKVMAIAKNNPDLPGAEQYFNDYKRVRDAAVKTLVELRRRNGTSTEAENVKGAHGSEEVQRIPVAEIQADPARFQFKSNTDPEISAQLRQEAGITAEKVEGGRWKGEGGRWEGDADARDADRRKKHRRGGTDGYG